MNTELFRKVQASIEAEGALNMENWESVRGSRAGAACGTTRCIAGWGIFHTTGAQVYTWRERFGWNENLDLSPETIALADSLGVGYDIPAIAGRLFGLTDFEENIFYQNDEVAREFIDHAADGEDDLAREVVREAVSEFDD